MIINGGKKFKKLKDVRMREKEREGRGEGKRGKTWGGNKLKKKNKKKNDLKQQN